MVHAKLRSALLLAPAVLMLAGVASACGGDDNTSKPATTVTASAPAANGTAANGTTAAEIDQDNLAFKPSKVTVKVGDKILVKNSESALHTFDVDGKNLSGNMKKGDTFIWTATKAGEFKVTCDNHPQMNATITVQ